MVVLSMTILITDSQGFSLYRYLSFNKEDIVFILSYKRKYLINLLHLFDIVPQFTFIVKLELKIITFQIETQGYP